MSSRIRIATFNVENLEDKEPTSEQLHIVPTFEERVAVLRPQLHRICADVLLFQEVHGQSVGESTRLRAFDKLLQGTMYEGFNRVSTVPSSQGTVEDKQPSVDKVPSSDDSAEVATLRNLVIVSRFEIVESRQFKHLFAPPPFYQRITAIPPEEVATQLIWERPILYTKIQITPAHAIHLVNIHLKSKNPDDIKGQKIPPDTTSRVEVWKSASGWAEGSFLASMKRVGQALEVRRFIDTLFDQDENALIIVGGDFNADHDEVPVAAIRGEVEETDNYRLVNRVMVPCERTIPESSRYSLIHRGRKEMIDHILVSRGLLAYYKGTEIHNEVLHDESSAFAFDKKFPESDHAPIITEFEITE
jgi:hypothetical protein